MSFSNRIKVTATGGTDDITLGAALPSFTAFNDGQTYYTILADNDLWEVGVGTVVGSSLQRETVEQNSAGNTSKTDFTGLELQVAQTLTAEWAEKHPHLESDIIDLDKYTQAEINTLVTDSQYDDTAIQAAVALNTAKRTYPLVDEAKLSNISGTNTGDQELFAADRVNTDVTIDLSNGMGISKVNIANSNTAYSLPSPGVNGGNETRLINAASEPTVTGMIKIKGSDFIPNTDMFMVSWNIGGLLQYHFQEIAP